MAYSISPFGLRHTKSLKKLDEELIDAVWKGRTRLIRGLVRQGANPDTRRGHHERTMLMLACERNNIDMEQTLLRAGAHADLPDNDLDTPLHVAARHGSATLLKLLHDKGAELEARNRSGRTALACAAETGKTDNVETLIGLGADPNAAMPHGITALHLATIYGNAATIAMLLKRGADPLAETDKGITPMKLARTSDKPGVLAAYQAHFSLRHTDRIHKLRRNRRKTPKPA